MSGITTKRTIYGNALQTAALRDKIHVVSEHSSLNEKFQVLPSEVSTNRPVVKYFAIGRGGHVNFTGEGGVSLVKSRPHRARDAALFQHLPFVMRELDNDLPPVERANYALRTTETINGVEYFCYYLKRLTDDNEPILSELNTVRDGSVNIEPFIPTPNDLSPIPVDIPSEGFTAGTGDTLSVTSTLSVDFNTTDAEYLLEVCRIRFNDESYATISEIAICSGEDFNTPANNQGANYNLLEAIAVQVSIFIACMQPVHFNNQGFTLRIDMGASEPLSVEGNRESSLEV